MNATIEAMRTARVKDEVKVTSAQMRLVVDGLLVYRSLNQIAADTHLSTTVVLDVVADFGTWLTHVTGGSGATTMTAAALRQQSLFQVPARTAKKAKAKAAAVNCEVVIPSGFERSPANKRDVSKALASIVVTNPGNEMITRYLARKYPTGAKVLTFEMVAVVWRFATLGRLDELDTINPDGAAFTQLVVAAYDVLEVARQDAIAGMLLLAAGDISDLDALRQACTKSRWLAERDIRDIEKLIEVVAKRPESDTLLRKELKFLAKRIEVAPSKYLVGAIAELNDGQVRRIGTANGLVVDGSDHAEEVKIRGRLQSMGLASDVDRLVPDGLKALQAGVLDVFWDAMQRRTDGDPTWDFDLVEAFETAS